MHVRSIRLVPGSAPAGAVLGTLTLAMVIGVAGCGPSGSGGSGNPTAGSPTSGATASSLPAAELPSLTLQATVATLGSAVSVLATGDALWVLDHNSPAVLRIDPATNTISGTTPLGEGYANGLGVAGGRIWTFHQTTGEMVGIDPATAKVVSTVAAGQDGDLFWVGDEAAWLITGGKLVRIDGMTAKVARLELAPGCDAGNAASGGGFVWLASASGAICKVDEQTGAVVSRGSAAGSGAGLVVVHGSPWLAAGDNGLAVLDPASLTVKIVVPPPAAGSFNGSTYSIGQAGGDNTVIAGNGDGATGWVRYTGSTIGRVRLAGDPSITLFAGFPADLLPGGVVEAFGSLWVANFGVANLERYASPTP